MPVLSLFAMATLLFAGPSAHIPPGVREALKTPDKWLVRAQTSAIPSSVRMAFTKASYGETPFHMAEPGREWQSNDVVVKHGLPWRRLGAVMSTSKYCIVTYEQGGILSSDHVVIFRFRPGGAISCGTQTRLRSSRESRNWFRQSRTTKSKTSAENCNSATGILEHPEILMPGSDRIAILVRHNSRYLMKVRQVVNNPCGQ
jgi:hypothetical protein